jgi:plasmid maintenance system antidote protein VapI
MALKLSRYFKMSPKFWLGLQMDYELDMAEDALSGRLEKEVTPMRPKREPIVALFNLCRIWYIL